MYKEPEQFRDTQYFKAFWQQMRKDKVALISFYLFLALLFLVFFGHIISPYSSEQQFVGLELLPPSWDKTGQVSHFFGTDDLGRDIFSRVLYGFYYTFGGALLITSCVVIIGGAIGVFVGLNRTTSLSLLGQLFDTLLFMPALLSSIIIASLMEPSLPNAMIAVFLATLPHFIHRIYQATQSELMREYVITLKLDGATNKMLIKEVILPNLIVVVVRESTSVLMFTVLDIAALSFISLGAKNLTPEWGGMIKEAFELIYIAPWTVMVPGAVITLVILIVSVLGRGVVRVLEKYRHTA